MRTFFEQPARYLLFRIGEVFERMPVEDSLGNVSEHVFKNKQPPEPLAPRADDKLCMIVREQLLNRRQLQRTYLFTSITKCFSYIPR